MIGIVAIGLATAELNTSQIRPHEVERIDASGSGTSEICDLGWGPEVIVRVGGPPEDERYKLPERFRQQSPIAYLSPPGTGEFGSNRRPGAGCPTKTLQAVRFREDIANHFRFDSSFSNAQRLDVRTRRGWNLQWKRLVGKSGSRLSMPQIDFRREMVLIATMGAQPSGGYRVEIEKLIERPKDIQAIVRHLSPGPRCGAIAVITHPMDMVRIQASHKPVHWVVIEQSIDCP
ncbi:MAG: protease complex subunit PrcB family protein [Pseudomonadota bacterium]|nr:protease complex subunit PrcB family protein [Pseudomonadota bacterium]